LKHTEKTTFGSQVNGRFALLVFGLSLTLYAITLPPTVLPGDGGELISASHTLSIAHPPGSPLYLMLGRVFARVAAWGSVALRYNLFSAVTASAAAALFFLVLAELGIGRLIALGLALALASNEAYWMNAVAAEVYALNALFTVLLVYAALLARRHGERALLLPAYIGGLAVSHHLTLAYSLIASGVVALPLLRARPRLRTAALCMFLFLIGLTAWLYIPIRASLAPPLTWGETDTPGGFVSHILGHRYAWRLKTFDGVERLGDFLRFFRSALAEIGIPLIALAVLGIAMHARRLRLTAGALLLVALFAAHYAAYNIPDIEGHILPAMIGFGILAGLGVNELVTKAGRHSKLTGMIITAAVFVLAIVNVISLTPRRDAYFAHDFAEAIARSAESGCGPGPVIITAGDLAGLSLAYLAHVENRDITLYMQGISHPSVIGSAVRPRSLGEAISIATGNFGASRICVLGLVESGVLPPGNTLCGMVSLPGPAGHDCPSPHTYRVRGAGEETRDFFSRALSAEYYLHLARWHIAGEDFTQASEFLDRAVGLSGDDAQTLVDASRFYVEMDRLEDAGRLLGDAIEAEPTHFLAHFALANIHQMRGQTDEAVDEYLKALKGNPDPGPTHVNLGNIYRSMEDYPRAGEHFRKALDLDGTNVTALMGMAASLEGAGNIEGALEYLDRAIDIMPDHAPAYHVKASLLLRMDRRDQAYLVLKQGLGSAPGDPALLSDMGLYHLREDRPDSAIAYLEEALEIRPDLLSARGNLAVACERLGLKSEAMEHYRRYIGLAPPGPSRKMAEQALERLEGN
jgi:tetratricopeptide (TPR) repeat protein